MIGSCPRCASRLQERSFGDLALDGCPECGGLWFDQNELNRLVKSGTANLSRVEDQYHRTASSEDDYGDRQCPKCNALLKPFSFDHTPNVKLDICPACKGLWVDDGELEAIHTRLTEGSQPQTAQVRTGFRELARSATSFLIAAVCTTCHASNPAGSQVCYSCGSKLTQVAVAPLCPRCDRPLMALDADGIPPSIGACFACGGIFLGEGEAGVLFRLPQQTVVQVQQAVMASAPQRASLDEFYAGDTAHCPTCRQPMALSHFSGDASLPVDTCPVCSSLWLDGGELVEAHTRLHGVGTVRSANDPWAG